jgi:two-component system chemotaxis response regulator CheY
MADIRRVLIVDDSATVCHLVQGLLRNCGFEQIDIVQDGKAALDCMQRSAFDIIICDWEMEPMSGIEVLKEVRRDPCTRATPFILMSAKKELSWVLEAKKAGADCLITKPFDAGILKMKIAQLGRQN